MRSRLKFTASGSAWLVDPVQFAHDLQSPLAETIRTTDVAFPTNTALTMTNGEPVLRRLKRQPEPDDLGLIDIWQDMTGTVIAA